MFRGMGCVLGDHVAMARAGVREGHVGCVWDGGGALRRGQVCQRGQGASRGTGCVLGGHGAVARAGAHEGHTGCIWDGGGMLRRSRVCLRGQGVSRGMGCILGGHGAVARAGAHEGCCHEWFRCYLTQKYRTWKEPED